MIYFSGLYNPSEPIYYQRVDVPHGEDFLKRHCALLIEKRLNGVPAGKGNLLNIE